MTWFLIWTCLVLGALALLAGIGWRLFRKGKALLSEYGATMRRIDDTTDRANRDFDEWLVAQAQAQAEAQAPSEDVR